MHKVAHIPQLFFHNCHRPAYNVTSDCPSTEYPESQPPVPSDSHPPPETKSQHAYPDFLASSQHFPYKPPEILHFQNRKFLHAPDNLPRWILPGYFH